IAYFAYTKRYLQAENQPHEQHIWLLSTLNPNAEKPKELFFYQAQLIIRKNNFIFDQFWTSID
ncbi:hypothetical protein I215_14301, partial [Galbibacter marinus]